MFMTGNEILSVARIRFAIGLVLGLIIGLGIGLML